MPFVDRYEAGRRLAERLPHLRGEDVVVLGLPRGGVPVASEVARAIGAPMDVIVVRKLGVPYQPELGMGALGEDGALVVDADMVRRAHVSEAELAELERRARAEIEQRVRRFRAVRPRIPLAGRTAVVVDDGIATGSTARAACQVARAQGAARVVLAVPVCARDTAIRLRREVDELECVEVPDRFHGVGQFYFDFRQTSDEEVVDLLRRAVAVDPHPVPAHRAAEAPAQPLRGRRAAAGRPGDLAAGPVDPCRGEPPGERLRRGDAGGTAVRSGGVGSSPAGLPGSAGCALRGERRCAAALWAAAEPGADVAAVVSRGGRPDLAATRLGDVRSPTLLVVGVRDSMVLELNRQTGGSARPRLVRRPPRHRRPDRRPDVTPKEGRNRT